MSAEERKLEEAPIVREVGGRSAGFEASGVLFRLPVILLAMVFVGSRYCSENGRATAPNTQSSTANPLW